MQRRLATSVVINGLILVSCLAACLAHSSVASATLFFGDQTKVNLASSREARSFAVPSGSGNPSGQSLAIEPSRTNHGTDFRANASGGATKYILDLGRPYNISSYNFTLHNVMTSANGSVRTSLDNITYSPPVASFSGAPANVTSDGNNSKSLNGTFPSVTARYVQLDVTSFAGFGQFIVSKAGIYGNNPNLLTTQGRFSVGNNISNGGTASVIDPWNNPVVPQNVLQAVDDGIDPLGRGNTILTGQYFPGGANQSNPGVPTGNPTQFTMLLNDTYKINRVGAATISDSRRWRDVNIYTSPDPSGNTFTLQQSLTNIAHTAGFFETLLPSTVDAKRIRFDVLTTYPGAPNPSTGVQDTWIAELYAFATAGAPILQATPASGSTISVGDAFPYGTELLTGAVTLQNTGAPGSEIQITGMSISPDFQLIGFSPTTLTVGLVDTATYDLLFSPVGDGPYNGTLTIFTSLGDVTYQLFAASVPEPSTFVLLSAGAVGMLIQRRRRRA